MPTYTPATKNTSAWAPEPEPGGAHTYNHAGVTYNQAGVTYNALKAATIWTPATKN